MSRCTIISSAATANQGEKQREFYDEYLAVMDLTAEFYLQTIDTVFVEHHPAEGDHDASQQARRPVGDPDLRAC